MAIIAKRPESTYTPCPEGLHHAVCVDVVDLGLIETAFGEKHKVRIVWQIEKVNVENDRRFNASKQYTLSLHDKANLRRDMEAWRGRKFTEEELEGFDLEKLIGVNCQIQVIHDLKDNGKVWANVQAIIQAPVGILKLTPLEYARDKDRPKERQTGQAGYVNADDIPF